MSENRKTKEFSFSPPVSPEEQSILEGGLINHANPDCAGLFEPVEDGYVCPRCEKGIKFQGDPEIDRIIRERVEADNIMSYAAIQLTDEGHRLIHEPESISADTFTEIHEGREVNFNIRETRESSEQFYKEHNLADFAASLPKDIKFSPESQARIREALKMGFDRAMIVPDVALQTGAIERLANETATKPQTGLSDQEQYTPPYFASGTKTARVDNRPRGKAYLLLYSSGPIPPETRNKTPNQLYPLFQANKWNGLTLPEYLLLQRRELEQNKDHSFDAYSDTAAQSQWTWLLDSQVPQADPNAPARVLRAYWSPAGRQVNVSWRVVGDARTYLGARPAVVIEIL